MFQKAGSSCVRVFTFLEERGQLQLFYVSHMNFYNQKEKERCSECKFMQFS